MSENRIEHDTMGDIEVSNANLWGSQTQRALMHFDISTEKMPLEFLWALAEVKRACILANIHLGLFSMRKGEPLLLAVEEVIMKLHWKEFPLSIWQTGSATQTNMNMNEVIANLATRLAEMESGPKRQFHPNDDVNAGQSSNDVIPTAIHVAGVCQIKQYLLPILDELIDTFEKKSKDFSGITKVGRTHLQDAVPLTLGQEFSGYLSQLRIARWAIQLALSSLSELAIGGTAVGTGINTTQEFAKLVVENLSLSTGIDFTEAENKFAAIAGSEVLVNMHGALKTLAIALMKISTDIRLMASGPRAGLGEISIPENEPGSSIMPGKVNPTQCEALAMICYQVMGNDVTIGMGAASGNFELNVFRPLILHNFLQSIRLLADGMNSFNQHCVKGIEPNLNRIKELMNASLMLATALSPHIGYEKTAAITKLAHEKNMNLREAAITSGLVTESDFDRWVAPEKLTKNE
ncbi:class II fumarate hydratase [Polynucleobacter sp. UK-Gri1-W3]|uniref:class II fumarate hydratase n=1 Tax=Polynucleobacter sp. UK-Gri1-W3 TaxID=1819737 RepID=UPI001C0B7DF4|nr:class II fumarate hydratase [Polynucleobacter sp. UK-Gri1-W3]MBU3538673.1 class II fumarate hydratase [Polynucleobacter sp. UK-Gri1-W3]